MLSPLGLLMIAVLAVTAIAGCGKKAPPRPPEGEQLPPMVTDLSGRIDSGELMLEWTVPKPTERNPLPASGFDVLLYRQPSGEPCPNCPPNYERVGRVQVLGNLEIAAGTQQMQFRIPVEPGHRYTVAVVAISDDGTTGPESNTLKIDF